MRYHLRIEAGRTWTLPIQATDPKSAISRSGYEFDDVVTSADVSKARCEVRGEDGPLGWWDYDRDRAPEMHWSPASGG